MSVFEELGEQIGSDQRHGSQDIGGEVHGA
jgi:hypothetical protein